MRKYMYLLGLAFCLLPAFSQKQSLRVTDNGHFLQYENGKPFFWLGDTAWELFHRLTLEDINKYLDNRQEKGFNVIQAVILADLGGKAATNKYGDSPLNNLDPEKPNEKYFLLIDSVVRMADQRNMIMALLPTWGDKVTAAFGGAGPVIFNPKNAYIYGKYLGNRYKSFSNIVWILGGDTAPEQEKEDVRSVWNALAKGIKDGSGKHDLMTFHPGGSIWHSSYHLHHADWLDFNMTQSGHAEEDVEIWKFMERDWALKPAKPVIDGEPCYEDHPINPWPTWDPKSGYFRDYDVRKQLYRSVFAGGFGVTYGHHSVWQAYQPGYEKLNHAQGYWYDAIDRPGAFQAGYLRKLIESRPYIERVPDQSLVLSPQTSRAEFVTAFRDEKNRYMMVYLPVGKEITVRTDDIRSKTIRGWWFNPANRKVEPLGNLKNPGTLTIVPPTTGKGHDWVLVLDDPGQEYSIPGK